jgi:hypothetical protein
MSSELSTAVQELLTRHQEHLDAARAIDAVLEQIEVLVGKSNGRRPALASRQPAVHPPGDESVKSNPRPRRGRSNYKQTAEEMVLSFVGQHKSPTGREINQHWKSQGRPWSADVTLGKLVREKKLKRSPLEGQRGSRYSRI